MRRASLLDGASADAAQPPDPARAELLHRVAAKVTLAVDGGSALTMTPAESDCVVTEAHELTERAADELRRPRDERDLRRAEEWLLTARALLEVAEATRS